MCIGVWEGLGVEWGGGWGRKIAQSLVVLSKPSGNICALFYCLITTVYVPCKQKAVHVIEFCVVT